MKTQNLILLSLFATLQSAWAVLPSEMPEETAKGFLRGIAEVKKTNDALIAELDRAIEADKAIQANQERIKQLQQENANIARQQQAARQAAQDVANAAQQAANAANLANTPMGGGGGGGGGGKGGGGGGGGRGMGNGVEAAEIMPSKGTEFAQPGNDVDLGGTVGAMASQGYSPMPAAQPFGSSTYQPALGSLAQQLSQSSQELNPGTIAASKGLVLQGGAKTGSAIADGAAAMAAAALANGPSANGKPAGGPQGGNGMPSSGGGGGDNMSGGGRSEMGDDGGKRPTVLATGEGAAGGGGEGTAPVDAPVEEEIAPAKGPNSTDNLAASSGKHVGDSNPIPQGLMTWVGWVDHVCRSESGKTLVGVCLGGTRMAAAGVAPLTTSVAEAMAKLAPSVAASDRAVASVGGEAKPAASAGTVSSLLELVSKYSK